MTEKKEIVIEFPNGKKEIGIFTISNQSPWNNNFNSPSFSEIELKEEDLFEALINLRKILEKHNCKILCNGARINVFPSAMSRDMSRGRKAYATKIGERGNPENIVDIFDYSEPNFIATIEDQKLFHEKWFNSIQQREFNP